ncbi:helix-turn-helix domain-containing protein [Arthrobacter sp. NPDC097144]|uniref:helix-turn-helix domain-containing protein n=1 Tax=Arthrobacter sp. NPDC097144 TaxID=3363946 RepID=UPI0038002C1A
MSDLDALFAPYPEKLSIDETAALLGISKKTAYKYLADGTIPAYKFGSSWIILRDDLKGKLMEGSNQQQD